MLHLKYQRKLMEVCIIQYHVKSKLSISEISLPVFQGIKNYTYSKKYDGIVHKSYREEINLSIPSIFISKRIFSISVKAKEPISIKNKNGKGIRPMMNPFRNKQNSPVIKPLYGIRKVVADFEESLIDVYIKNLKSKFGVEMIVKNDAEIEIITNWIRKRDPKFKYHIANPYGLGNKKEKSFILEGIFIIKVAPATYLYVDAKSYGTDLIQFNRRDEDTRSRYNPIYLYLFGRKSLSMFNRLTKYIESKNTSDGKIYSITGVKDGNNSFWNCTSSKLTPRTMDTIFIDDIQKKRIIEHIDHWVNSEELYSNRNLLYKTGILLYGNPGTGKSSMAMAIANYLGCSLITIDPTTFQYINIPEVSESIVADEIKYVVLIDEIDTIFKSRDDKNASEEQIKNTAKLMSFLDSQQSPTKVLFIATTNYIERLDKALLRKGRFDLVEKMGDIPKDVAINMCKSFGLTYYESLEIIEEMDNTDALYNPSTLQDAILNRIKEKEQRATDNVIDDNVIIEEQLDEPNTSDITDGEGLAAKMNQVVTNEPEDEDNVLAE